MRRLWRENRLVFIGFILAAALTLFFATRLTLSWIYWNDPAHRDQAIAGWMTPRYIDHSWRIPPEILAETLGLEPGSGRPQTLAEIAEERGTTVEALAAEIEAAAKRHRATKP
jgi:hypothetical protein